MARHRWEQLPAAVHDAITARSGTVERVEHAAAGSVGDFAATLDTSTAGRIFGKGARLDSDRIGFLRNEVRLNEHLPHDLAPRLRWHTETAGWLVDVFDHAPGTCADLHPGSPDLPVVADALTRMAAALTPCPPINIQPATTRWGSLIDPALVEGDTLLHTDMTHNNFLIASGRAKVVDWSMPCRGATWLDTARMLVRLIRAGHTPAEAESWAGELPMWADAPRGAVDAFAAALARLSRRLRGNGTDAPHLTEMAAASDSWLRHRTP